MKMTFQTVKAVENCLLTTLPVKENITAGIVDGYFALIVSLSQFQAVLKDALPEFAMFAIRFWFRTQHHISQQMLLNLLIDI